MRSTFTRRDFVKTVLAGAAGACLQAPGTRGANNDAYAFVVLGDLHFDRLEHHDLERLQQEKPDDVRQIREYSRLRAEILPRLFATVRDTVADSSHSPETRVAFAVQVGDLVEGLCGSENRALQQDTEAIEFVRGAKLDVPFLFTKGNHDITGSGAADAFKTAF